MIFATIPIEALLRQHAAVASRTRPRLARWTLLLCTLTVVTGACSADSVRQREADAAVTEQTLAPPRLDPLPTATNLQTVALRGRTDGQQIIAQGGPDGTCSTLVFPDGSFCVECRLFSAGETTFTIYALGAGLVSTSVVAAVTYDSTATTPVNPNCGDTPQPCDDIEECTNDQDDNCDGWIDACDLMCSGCKDDDLEPNNYPFAVPGLVPGTYYQLKLCPCRDDWWAFHVEKGEAIDLSVTFSHSLMDIDLHLYRAKDAEAGDSNKYVAESIGKTNRESIDWTATTAGTYYLWVHPFTSQNLQSSSYTMTIR